MDDKLKRVFAETLEIDAEAVSGETAMENVAKWDSLSHMRIVLAVEEAFDIRFTPQEMVQMVSFQALRQIVAGKLG